MDLKSRKILPIRPSDSFTQVKFNPFNSRFACASSWDGCVYLFDTENSSLCCRYCLCKSESPLVQPENGDNEMHSKDFTAMTNNNISAVGSMAATNSGLLGEANVENCIRGILTCDWASANIIVSGCTDNTVYATDILTHNTFIVGRCLAPVRCVYSLPLLRSVCVSGGWDGFLYFWDCSEEFLNSSPIYIRHSNEQRDLIENQVVYSMLPMNQITNIGINANRAGNASHQQPNSLVVTNGHIISPPFLHREPLLGKVFCMDVKRDKILVGESGRFMQMFSVGVDSATNSLILQKLMERETPLRHQIRSIQFLSFGDDEIDSIVSKPVKEMALEYNKLSDIGFALGSVEGRIAVDSLHRKNRFAFRCHRKVEVITLNDGNNNIAKSNQQQERFTGELHNAEKPIKQETIISYPVNAMANLKGFLVSAGADNTICLWDIAQKIRVYCMNEESGVADVAVSEDQKKIAITLGYTWERGEKGVGISRNAIVVINTDEFFRSKEMDAAANLLGN